MISLTIIIGILVGSLVYLVNFFRSQLSNNRDINKLPGPSPLQLLWQTLGPKSNYEKYSSMIVLNEKYGPVVKLWIKPFKPTIMVADADLMDKILTSKDHLVKTQMYDLLKPYLGEGLATTSNANVWRHSRKMCNTAFQHKTITGFLPIFQKYTDTFLETLKSESGKPVDTQHVIHLFTLDIIFESLMKQRSGFQEENNPIYINARVDYFTVLTERLYSVFLTNNWIFTLSKHFKKMESVLTIIKKFTRDIITRVEAERKGGVVNEKSKIHLIDILFDSDLSGEDLNDQINTFILAGHDTVAQSMGFTLYELSRRSVIQKKLLEEIQSIVGKDPNAEITYKDLHEMKYLEAVVKESLRLHTVVPIIERKVSYDIEHNGIRYPKDTTFMFNIDAIHKSERYYPNPKEYDPIRFMSENAHLIKKNTYVPFSIGPRDCIGKLYAMLVVKFFVAKCLQKFELLPVENHSLKMLSEIVNKSITGAPVILKERSARLSM